MTTTHPAARRAPRARVARLGLVAAAALALSGCSADQLRRGYLPAESVGATNHTPMVQDLWNGSWIAALAVGVIVWGLTIWCVIAYRRRKGDPEVPPQFRYHLPLEVMYTALPLMMVAVLFYYTAVSQAAITDLEEDPDVTIEVIGKQWSWDFNYVDEDVYETGVQADLDGEEGAEDRIPTLVLPVDERVEFHLFARDVNHSFWIPAFLFKMDNIAGRQNRFQLVPTKEGTFQGKCAELCGEYHSEMLFNVAVVSREEYDDYIALLRARGQTGQLETDLNRSGLTGEVGGSVTGQRDVELPVDFPDAVPSVSEGD
ncbi:aa3-type cytochrome oxidase subunit II [Aquipuribacter sp. SD81]|uniref:aa3-type cytochrome oxidase subunit II n=1 Tax=Aquipuribacter sp. SD81 TaxID=3127703 RepID=UPI003016F86C